MGTVPEVAALITRVTGHDVRWFVWPHDSKGVHPLKSLDAVWTIAGCGDDSPRELAVIDDRRDVWDDSIEESSFFQIPAFDVPSPSLSSAQLQAFSIRCALRANSSYVSIPDTGVTSARRQAIADTVKPTEVPHAVICIVSEYETSSEFWELCTEFAHSPEPPIPPHVAFCVECNLLVLTTCDRDANNQPILGTYRCTRRTCGKPVPDSPSPTSSPALGPAAPRKAVPRLSNAERAKKLSATAIAELKQKAGAAAATGDTRVTVTSLVPKNTKLSAEQEAARVKRNKVISEIAERVRSGWVLTARVCPRDNCLTTLIRNSNGQTYCVACQLWCVNEKQIQPSGTVSSQVSGTFTPLQPVVTAKPESNTDRMSTPQTKPSAAAAATSTTTASAGGAAAAPKAGDNSNSAYLAGMPDDFGDEYDPMDGDDFEPAATSGSAVAKKAVDPAAAERTKRMNDVSKKLGEKLLMGYAMLEQTCPGADCNCPLMRDKKGVMHCVACGSTFDAEKLAAIENGTAAAPSTAAAAKPAATNSAPAPAPAAAPAAARSTAAPTATAAPRVAAASVPAPIASSAPVRYYHRAGRRDDRSDDDFDDDESDDPSGDKQRQKERERLLRLQAAAQRNYFQSATSAGAAAGAADDAIAQRRTAAAAAAAAAPAPKPESRASAKAAPSPYSHSHSNSYSGSSDHISSAIAALHAKIGWCSRLIHETENLSEVAALSSTITSLAAAVQSLNKL